jgi:dGTPase
VRDGILTHTGEREPATLEGKIVRLVDRVAYINHDIDDAIRFGILAVDDLPTAEAELLGSSGSERIDTLVHDLVEHSERAGDIVQGEAVGEAMLSLRSFMFERVYLGPHTRAQHEQAREAVRRIFDKLAREESPDAGQIVDYLSGMTDRFALEYAETL